MRRAATRLAERLPDALRPLADVSYNYWWSWTTTGPQLFATIDPSRWERCGHNPVRLLLETSSTALGQAAARDDLLAVVNELASTLTTELEPGGARTRL